LQRQAGLVEEDERGWLLEQAIACYQAALEVLTEREMPWQQQQTRANLKEAKAALVQARGE
ncbi:MAG TPA: hypothetical protein VGR57_07795, partial [Ktedonobacterales bacterium]|nr:hypothetical protein [Ktedonobacterales bacterium]